MPRCGPGTAPAPGLFHPSRWCSARPSTSRRSSPRPRPSPASTPSRPRGAAAERPAGDAAPGDHGRAGRGRRARRRPGAARARPPRHDREGRPVSCRPIRPCGATETALGLVPPPPGQRPLRRRVGEFHAFVADLVRRVEQEEVADAPLGGPLGPRGRPAGRAPGGAVGVRGGGRRGLRRADGGRGLPGDGAPTGPTSAGSRRSSATGRGRGSPRRAGCGWRSTSDADPLVPAGTRVQAPGTPERPAQTFEVVADTPLRAEWAGLTATWVPTPAVPEGREMRFLGNPGFRAGDRVLFVLEEQPEPPPMTSWFDCWDWLFQLDFGDRGAGATATPLAIASVVESRAELGTTVGPLRPRPRRGPHLGDRSVRRLSRSWPPPGWRGGSRWSCGPRDGRRGAMSYAVSRRLADRRPIALGGARRRSRGPLAGQHVAVVDWERPPGGQGCDVVEVAAARAGAVGRRRRERPPASRSSTSPRPSPTLARRRRRSRVYVLDRRIVARHYAFPETGAGPRRLYPRAGGGAGPDRGRAGRRRRRGVGGVRVRRGRRAGAGRRGRAARGLIVDLIDGAPERPRRRAGQRATWSASTTARAVSAVLGSGDAPQAGPALHDARTRRSRYDLDARRQRPRRASCCAWTACDWDERAEPLRGRPARRSSRSASAEDGAADARVRRRGAGRAAADGPRQRDCDLPRRRRHARARSPRAPSTRCSAASAGSSGCTAPGRPPAAPTRTTSADLRQLAPTRARAFGRAVSIEDLVDLALGFPGVSHAAAWNGAGPPGCAVRRLRPPPRVPPRRRRGPRAPLPPEITSSRSYLDCRRDPSVALCVCAGVVTAAGRHGGAGRRPAARRPVRRRRGGPARPGRRPRAARPRSASRSTAQTSPRPPRGRPAWSASPSLDASGRGA